MKVKGISILLCAFVFLFSVPAVGVELYASGEATFAAPELLGRPTDTSVTVNAVAEQDVQVKFQCGTSSGVYTEETDPAWFTANEPIEVVIDGLTSNTQYYYRMLYRESDPGEWILRDEHSFHTQRAQGETFTFTIISDSHMNGGGGQESLYVQTLNNVADDTPDFHFDLGDTFWMDRVSDIAVAKKRYLNQRNWMGAFSHSVPVFLATGNHEQEEGWNFDDTPTSSALLSIEARKLYYPNPVTDGFYSGNTDPLPEEIGGDRLRENYYAWEWGDALLVVIDPFHYTMTRPYGNVGGDGSDDSGSMDRWDWTLGKQQFNWFKRTLENSDATYKFVFAHHMVGGLEDYVRGGAGAAYLFEWGGYDENGTTWRFHTERPGWGSDPIHQFMIDNGVSAFFHGHDHQYAYEKRDGIVYQCVPQPSTYTNTSGFSDVYSEDDPYTIRVLPNGGHLRVTVSPTQATVEYVRSYLTGDGTNGEVSHTYTFAGRCVDNADCDDSLFCNGTEICLRGTCMTMIDPCPGQMCDEDRDTCVDYPKVPPTVITDDATDITANSATLNGRLDSLGDYGSVDVSFEWGTSPEVYTDETTPREMTSTGPCGAGIDGLSSNTTYYFRIKATGSTNFYGDEISFTTLTSYDMPLGAGWNLVSLPLVPSSDNIDDILADIMGNVDSVWAYDADARGWSFYAPGEPSDLTEMSCDRGYWMRVNDACTLTVVGTEPPLPCDIPLGSEWNLIGLPLIAEPQSMDDILADIIDNIDSVWAYDNATGRWAHYAPGEPSDLTEMGCDKGYWIKVDAPCTLTVHE